MKSFRNIAFFLVLGIIGFSTVFAVGVSVTPPSLELLRGINGEISGEIAVSNPSEEVAVFNVYPDEFEGMVKVSPVSFILEGGRQKIVKVNVNPKNEGMFETTLSVVSEPLLKSSFNAVSGVKIPISFTAGKHSSRLALIAETMPFGIRIVGIFVFFGLLVALFFLIRYATDYFKGRIYKP
jgi:hypothetical protein